MDITDHSEKEYDIMTDVKKMVIAVVVMAMVNMYGFAMAAEADKINVIPQPIKVDMLEGDFRLIAQTQIICGQDKEILAIGQMLAGKLNRATGYSLKAVKQSVQSNEGILLQLSASADERLGTEGYRLAVRDSRISISANKAAGVFYGVQTLLQLLPAEIASAEPVSGVDWKIPCVDIVDYPRFGWRGLLWDMSRHFFTKAQVKRYIDEMVRYKFNVFHWHLTDDQGWRLEIKAYPKLTEVGAWRVPRQGYWWTFDPPGNDEAATDGGFFTQDDIREIVAYAAKRYVTIVPEIDVPGHSMAALASYPELSCTGGPFKVNPGSEFYGKIQNTLCVGNKQVYVFMENVLSEVAQLFPGRYVHIGGDEAHKSFWAKCPKCQQLKKDKGLKSENELQSYFIKRMEKILQSKGKRLIGWDEILEGGLAPNATVMSWRGVKGGIAAAKAGHEVVMTPSPYYYLDLYQGDPVVEPRTYSMSRLRTCYNFEPVPQGVDEKLVLGTQGNLWSEEVSEMRHAQYMTWPRGMAVAETAWSAKNAKNWKNFAKRVEKHLM